MVDFVEVFRNGVLSINRLGTSDRVKPGFTGRYSVCGDREVLDRQFRWCKATDLRGTKWVVNDAGEQEVPEIELTFSTLEEAELALITALL